MEGMFSLVFTLLSLNSMNATADPDQSKYILDIVSEHGFTSEIHYTTTLDGYILELHRILPLNDTGDAHNEPVILMPGMGCTSAAYIVNSPHVPRLNLESNQIGNNLALVLSQAGYDVWLPNVRGNKYSINHVNMTIRDEKFWNYSLDEIVRFDLPAIINYVRNHSQSETLAYVGHSQGTTLMFALLASQPKLYTPIIKPFIALAPAVLLSTGTMGILENFFHDHSYLFKPVHPSTCDNYPRVCDNFIDLIFGPNSKQLNKTRLNVYLAHVASSFSLKTVQHFLQIYDADRFQRYDYGEEINLLRYKQAKPEPYPLENIRSPYISLIYSANDHLVSLDDIKQVKNSLKVPLFDDYLIPDEHWNHIDFILGLESGRYVNTRILRLLARARLGPDLADNEI